VPGERGRRDGRREATRQSRLRCERILAELGLGDGCTLAEVRDRLPSLTGRPLRVVLSDQPGTAPSGAWLRTADEDLVLVDRGASPLHREHILAHEVAHILLGHRGRAEPELSSLLPGIDPSVVSRVLTRHTYSDAAERDAELLASLIMSRAGSAPSPRDEGDDDRWLRVRDRLDVT
jgi:hypothetical protein